MPAACIQQHLPSLSPSKCAFDLNRVCGELGPMLRLKAPLLALVIRFHRCRLDFVRPSKFEDSAINYHHLSPLGHDKWPSEFAVLQRRSLKTPRNYPHNRAKLDICPPGWRAHQTAEAEVWSRCSGNEAKLRSCPSATQESLPSSPPRPNPVSGHCLAYFPTGMG